MKPISQINHNQLGSRRDNRARRKHRSSPLTDYNFQATVDAKASSAAVRPATKSPAFHKLSSEFLGAETNRDYVTELFFFILITGIAAWPVMSMLIAVIRMIRNY
jgi:hypothetical protein